MSDSDMVKIALDRLNKLEEWRSKIRSEENAIVTDIWDVCEPAAWKLDKHGPRTPLIDNGEFKIYFALPNEWCGYNLYIRQGDNRAVIIYAKDGAYLSETDSVNGWAVVQALRPMLTGLLLGELEEGVEQKLYETQRYAAEVELKKA